VAEPPRPLPATRPALETEIAKAQLQDLHPHRGQALGAERPVAEMEAATQAVGARTAVALAESPFREAFLAVAAHRLTARFR